MNSLKKGIATIILLTILTYTASASTPITDTKVLTPPVWLPYDILLDNENIPRSFDNSMFSESEMGFTQPYQGKQKFTNKVDGYSIVLPSDMLVDMSLSDVCTTFRNDRCTLRIFKETFNTVSERLSYLSYSNKFLENTVDHKLERQDTIYSGDKEIHILQWSRSKLARIVNDRNYYTCVDVCIGARVYTFFYSSSRSFLQENDYLSIAESIVTFDPEIPAANAYNRGYKKSDVSHFNTTTAATYNKLFSDDANFKMGIFSPDKFGGNEKIKEFENTLNYNFAAVLFYTELTDRTGLYGTAYNTKVNAYLAKVQRNFEYAKSSGKVMELTLQTPLSRDSDKNMIYEILNGDYDIYLRSYAKLIASNPTVTVLFRLFNEMNGDWCNYSAFHTSRDPQIYVELYRYIHKTFSEYGCKNIIWVWNPNERSFPNYKWNHQDLYYPGDDYVDVYGITGYNNGTYYEGEKWRSFDEIYGPIYERALKSNEKPLMITEFSCSAIGGDKIAWINDMFLSLPKYDKIKLGIWWHATDYDGENLSRPYFMDTPTGTMDVFDRYLN